MRIDILNISESNGAVMVERLDNWRMHGEDKRLPAVGVLIFKGNLVKEWREYYDLNTLKGEMANH